MVIQIGDKSVGFYHFPDKRTPHICYTVRNEIYDCGHFNNEDAAERFMNALVELFELFGIERMDGEHDDKG